MPERQFCQSASFAREPVLPESHSLPVLPERQFCQSAKSFPVLLQCQLCQSVIVCQFCQSASFARVSVCLISTTLWQTGKTSALAKQALWKTGSQAKLQALWQTSALANLRLGKNWRSGKIFSKMHIILAYGNQS